MFSLYFSLHVRGIQDRENEMPELKKIKVKVEGIKWGVENGNV